MAAGQEEDVLDDETAGPELRGGAGKKGGRQKSSPRQLLVFPGHGKPVTSTFLFTDFCLIMATAPPRRRGSQTVCPLLSGSWPRGALKHPSGL